MSTRTQALEAAARQDLRMLWSDPKNEPSREVREMQAMLRRAGLVIAVAAVTAALALGQVAGH